MGLGFRTACPDNRRADLYGWNDPRLRRWFVRHKLRAAVAARDSKPQELNMRKTLITIATVAALAATPALAQGRSGGAHGGGGGGMGGGMGAGPPISPPGHGTFGDHGASGSARDIASQRGEFGRDFAASRRMTTEQRQAMVQERRSLAMQYAQAARSGRPLPRNADREIRSALSSDIDQWRDEFRVGRTEWQSMRNHWIADRSLLTPAQWAQRRADWFATRDAWITRNRAYAQTRR